MRRKRLRSSRRLFRRNTRTFRKLTSSSLRRARNISDLNISRISSSLEVNWPISADFQPLELRLGTSDTFAKPARHGEDIRDHHDTRQLIAANGGHPH